MGKTSESKDTTYNQTPAQKQLLGAGMNQYIGSDGKIQGPAAFDYNTDPTLQATGANFVQGFSAPQTFAFDQTLQHYGQQEPIMGAAQGMTFDAGGTAGTIQGAPDGWTIDPSTGQANYQTFDQGVQKYMNPFTSDVAGTTIDQAMYGLQRANMASDSGAVSRNSFGGTRQSVLEGLNTDATMRSLIPQLANLNLTGFNQATGQYNTGFTQGEQAIAANTGVEQANRAAELASASQLGNQAGQAQTLQGNDINAVNNVGSQIQGLGQNERNAAFQDLMTRYGIPLQVATGLYGLTGQEGSTQTTTPSTSSSIFSGLGTAVGAGAMMLSDEDAKEGVKPADPKDSLSEIRKLKPKSFSYTDFAQSHGAPAGERTGFMAQDLERATGREAPEGPGGFKHVDMMEHLGRLTQAVQALDAKVHSRGRSGMRRAA